MAYICLCLVILNFYFLSLMWIINNNSIFRWLLWGLESRGGIYNTFLWPLRYIFANVDCRNVLWKNLMHMNRFRCIPTFDTLGIVIRQFNFKIALNGKSLKITGHTYVSVCQSNIGALFPFSITCGREKS